MEELKIGIVAEGISDYWVIKHIVERFLKDKRAYTVALQNNKGAALHLYSFILAKKKKPKEILDISKYNVGFSKFVDLLAVVKII